MTANFASPNLIWQLQECLLILADMIELDAEAVPFFERIDAELAMARAKVSLKSINDPITRARELVRLKREADAPHDSEPA